MAPPQIEFDALLKSQDYDLKSYKGLTKMIRLTLWDSS
jgi:hypothetical protein